MIERLASIDSLLHDAVLATAPERMLAPFLGIVVGSLIFFVVKIAQDRWLQRELRDPQA